MKNRKRVWVPLLVLLLVAAIWYSRPVTLPDLLKDQELQEINVLIRSLGTGPRSQRPPRCRCPSLPQRGRPYWNSSKTSPSAVL